MIHPPLYFPLELSSCFYQICQIPLNVSPMATDNNIPHDALPGGPDVISPSGQILKSPFYGYIPSRTSSLAFTVLFGTTTGAWCSRFPWSTPLLPWTRQYFTFLKLYGSASGGFFLQLFYVVLEKRRVGAVVFGHPPAHLIRHRISFSRCLISCV